MAYTYPLALPAVDIVGFAMRPRRVVAISSSPFTGQQQVQEHPGAWWEAEVTFAPMERDRAAEFRAFLLKLHGRRGTFLLGDPMSAAPRGTAIAAVVSGAGQTGAQLAVSGMGAGKTLRAGDYVELPGHRLHMVVDDVTASGTGTAILNLEPALRSSPANGAALVLVNPRGAFRLTADAGWSEESRFHNFTISCVEAL